MEVASSTTQTSSHVLPRSWDLLLSLSKGLLPQARVFRYGCPKCFESLWSLLSDNTNAEPLCSCMSVSAETEEFASRDDLMRQPFIVAYDGIPAVYARPKSLPEIHLDNIFSPAVLFTLLAAKNVSNPIHWLVLDPHERTRTNKDTRAIAELLTPHLQVIDGSETDLLSALERVQESIPCDQEKLQAAEVALEHIMTAPGNRHAVSNVVGPVLLGFQPEEPDMEWIVSHLRYVHAAIGLAPAAGRNVMTLPDGARQALAALGSTEFVLIDDQHRNGWGQIVKNAFGEVKNLEVSLHDSPEFLLAKLEETVNGERLLRDGLTVGEKNCSNEVMLLDLRLFDGSSLHEEVKFFSRVIALAARLGQRRGLAWRGFTEGELSRVQNWVAAVVTGVADRSDPVYLEALALFPRVLSLIAPSLPIVIFSSTGKKEITEKVKGYGNIITDFEKPRLFEYQNQDLLSRTANSFWTAINKAISMRRGSLVRSAVA